MRIKYRYLIVELIFEKKANEAAQREGITTTEIYHRCVRWWGHSRDFRNSGDG